MKHTQILLDLKYDGDLPDIKKIMDNAITNNKELTVVETFTHKFNPYGLSIVYILAESHISIHTWEEYKIINLDVFTCGKTSPDNTINQFIKDCNIVTIHKQKIQRGF